MKRQTTIYLKNKDIIREINKSKISYSSFVSEEYENYDYIVGDIESLEDPEVHQLGIEARAKRLTELAIYEAKLEKKKLTKAEAQVDPATIKLEDVVFRVMTFDHVPEDLDRKKTHKREADRHAKVNFPPFQHFVLENGTPRIVGKSHWVGGMDNGYFSTENGTITDTLSRMYILLIERNAVKSNWRDYSYNGEFKSTALLQLTESGLKYNEFKSENPFSYLTTCVTNAFTGCLNREKKQQKIRDALLIHNGVSPSYTKIIDHEFEMREKEQERTESEE